MAHAHRLDHTSFSCEYQGGARALDSIRTFGVGLPEEYKDCDCR
ncbi:hypothetical protein BIFGAL_03585 [Bifidobacterium gallicum DSM 20093 = LMG 11596]|uniref:Uncharacterized protein n=1 Tax=Bifidobacterium gallicum DSM 20093 = LMG 11596 TaxID=561180 RepID=D1NUQ9_9BIFI|nr:hypothetical protein BIFGAL_03585 [Bifidobacterium gallicum DSM 20093 = LMG 11596]